MCQRASRRPRTPGSVWLLRSCCCCSCASSCSGAASSAPHTHTPVQVLCVGQLHNTQLGRLRLPILRPYDCLSWLRLLEDSHQNKMALNATATAEMKTLSLSLFSTANVDARLRYESERSLCWQGISAGGRGRVHG